MSHETITSPAQLADFCRRLARADRIGIDTEFVSEDTFRPELCLIQVATKDELAVIDPYRVGRPDAVLADAGRRQARDDRSRGPRGSELRADRLRPAAGQPVRHAARRRLLQRGVSVVLRLGRHADSSTPGRPRASSGPIGAAGR